MILIISIIFYMVLFLFNKKLGFVYYQLFAATTYLISLSFIQTLDLTLTLYLCFSVLPYIKYFKVDSIHKFILLLFFLLHLIVSSIMNNPFNALSIFIIRLSGLFVYIFIFKNVDDECIIYEKSNRKLAFLFLLCEVIIFIIGFLLSPDGRLMLNFQCTVGCIATSSMILLSYYLLNDTNDRFFVFIAMFLLTLISCLSGTRGYIIICVVILSLNIIFYCSIKEKILFSFLGFLICLFKYKDILDMILIKSRFGESTGRRNIENSFIIKLMFRGPLHRLLLGNGFGTPANTVPLAKDIVNEVSNDAWASNVIFNGTGYHNFWFTILYASGLAGLILILLMYIHIIIAAINCNTNKKNKAVYLIFLFLYAFTLWFRWTATSGIFEFAIFSTVIHYIKFEDNKSMIGVSKIE